MSISSRRLTRALLSQFFAVRRMNPARTDIYDANSKWTATLTDGCVTALVRGAERTFSEKDRPLEDTFNRTRTSGWGALTTNGAWSESGAADAANTCVDNGSGKMIVSMASSAYRATVVTHHFAAADIAMTVGFDKMPVGAPAMASLITHYQDGSNYYQARASFGPTAGAITDNFNRMNASGWGTSTSGTTWSYTGAASDYTVDGSTGLHAVSTLNTARRSFAGTGNDFDVSVRVATDAVSGGASMSAGFVARYVDSDNHYIFRLRFATNQSIGISVQKQEAGVNTTLGSEYVLPGVIHSAGTYYWIRARGSGATLEFKAWLDGASEPASWQVSVSDAAFSAAGGVGPRSVVSTGSTNTLPVVFRYDDYNCAYDDGIGSSTVRLQLYKQVAGNTSSIGSSYDIGVALNPLAGDTLTIRMSTSGGVLAAKAWKTGTAEPASWQVSAIDSTFSAGRVGVRSYVSSGATNLPLTYAWSNLSVTGTWAVPPQVTHDKWLRVLPRPFDGILDEAWLVSALGDSSPDILAMSMDYIYGATAQINGEGVRYIGDASYGPLLADGTRQEGSDFYDYLGVAWNGHIPDGSRYGCVDCSGFISLSYGYRGGVDPLTIASNARGIAASGTGVVVIADSGAAPSAAELTTMQVGDIVCFDNDTASPEPAGQIDHVGYFLGVDSEGLMRIMSSRKGANGPTFTDIGGASIVGGGTGTYATGLRVVRRF